MALRAIGPLVDDLFIEKGGRWAAGVGKRAPQTHPSWRCRASSVPPSAALEGRDRHRRAY